MVLITLNIKLILQYVVYMNFIAAVILVVPPIVSVTESSNSTTVAAKNKSDTSATSTSAEPIITSRATRHLSRSMIIGTTTPAGRIKSNGDTGLLPQNAITVAMRRFLASTSTDRIDVITRSESPVADVKKPEIFNFTTMRSQSEKFARIPVTYGSHRCHNAKNNTATSSPTTLSFSQATNRTFVDVEKSTIDIVQQLSDSRTTIEPITFTNAMTTTPSKTKNSDEMEKVVIRTTVLVTENGTNEEIARVQLINDSSIANKTKASILMTGDDTFNESAEVEPFRKAANISNQLENFETISVKVKLVNQSNEFGTNRNINTTVDEKFQTRITQVPENLNSEKHEQFLSTSSSIEDDYTELANIQLIKKNESEFDDSWEDIGQVATNVRIIEVKNENDSGTSSKSEENDLREYNTNSTLFQQNGKSPLLSNPNFTQEFKNTTTILTSSTSTKENNPENQDLETTLATQLATTTHRSQTLDISTIFEMNVNSVSSTTNPISMSSKQVDGQLNDSNLVVNNTLLDTFHKAHSKSETIDKLFETNQTDNYTSHKSQTSTIKPSTYSATEDKLTTFTTSPSFDRAVTNEIRNFSMKSGEPEKFALFIRNDPLIIRQSTSIQGERIQDNTAPIEPSSISLPVNVQEHRSEYETETVESPSEAGTSTENGIAIEAVSSANFSTNVVSTPRPGVANSTETKFENYDLSSTHDGSNTENCTSVSDFPASVSETNLVNSSDVSSPTATVISFPQLPFEESNFTEIYVQKIKMHPIKYINSVNYVNISPGLNYRTVSSISSNVLPPATTSFGNTTSMPVFISSVHNTDTPSLTSISQSFESNSTVKTNSSAELTTNPSSSNESQDTMSIDSPWRNISLTNYKILLDSLMENKVKPATQILNITKIPLVWLKSSPSNVTPSSIQLTDAPFQTNTTVIQEENINFQSSQSLRNSSNAIIPLELAIATATLKNEHQEARPEAKVYDPLISYPAQYPKAYQTIQNGPALVVARTTHTTEPNVTHTTITATTLPSYQQMQKVEEAFAETLLDRKLRERSFRKENNSNNDVSISISEGKSKYFDANITKIEANAQRDEIMSDRKRSHQQQTKNHIKETPRKGESTDERNTSKFIPSLDEKDLKIVQNFVNKNSRVLR